MKSLDIVVLCKLLSYEKDKQAWTYQKLSKESLIPIGEVHASIKRLVKSNLYNEVNKVVNRKSMEEFLLHGMQYVFPPEYLPIERGVGTSHNGPVLNKEFDTTDHSIEKYVWPYYKGKEKGIGIKPLSKRLAEAALKDIYLHKLLSVIDALRAGKARDKNFALSFLKSELAYKWMKVVTT